MNVYAFLVLFGLSIGLSGCSKNLTDFVKGARPPPGDVVEPESPVRQGKGAVGLKLSPGHMKGTAANAAVEARVTSTDTLFPAADVSVRLTVGRVRNSTKTQ